MPKNKENSETKKKLSKKEFEKKILELAEKGLTTEKIGLELKKQGINAKEFSTKISKILKEHNLYISPDLKNIEAKLQRVEAHYAKNKQDKRAKRERERIFSQLRRIKKYLGIRVR